MKKLSRPSPTPSNRSKPLGDITLERVRGGNQPGPAPATVSASDDWMAPVV
jgi:hypothetical protein